MAVLTRSHPTDPDTDRHYNGKTITAVEVDFAVNGTDFSSTELGAEGALQAAVKVLTQEASPIIQGNLEADSGANACLLYTSPSPRDATLSRMPSSA